MNKPDYSKPIRIVAAVVDVHNLVLYKEDGETIIIPQGDVRLRPIIEEVTPQLIEKKYADIIIDKPQGHQNSYADFEKKQTSGIVKFFRIAKAKLAEIFAPSEPVAPTVVGEIPVADTTVRIAPTTYSVIDVAPTEVEIVKAEVVAPEATKMLSVVDEIMAHAMPVTDPEFHDRAVAKQGNVVEENGTTSDQKNEVDQDGVTDTIVAVVDGQVIPGMEKIKTQFDRAAKLGSTQGVERFLQRIAAVISNRQHSVEDLLKFMERADLPIADDGTIVIYKILKRNTNNKFVDCHSGKVEQWVGAYVCMSESLVDHDRRNECSNGLHVARRGYLRQFSGDVCVLAKLAPEDVIAVPIYDANKMRVCGYHIIMELPASHFALLQSNKPITSTEEGKTILHKALTGQHIGRTDEVRIGAAKGGNVTVKKLAGKPVEMITPLPPEVEVHPAENLDEEGADESEVLLPVTSMVNKAEALGNPEQDTAGSVDPLQVVQAVETVKAQLSRKEQAEALYAAFERGEIGSLDALIAFKKAAKVSWDKLGVTDPTTVLPAGTKPVSKKGDPVPPAPKSKRYDKTAKKTAKAKAKVKSSSPNKQESEVIIPPQEFKAPKVKPVPQVHSVDFGDEPKDRTGEVDVEPVKEGSNRQRIQKLISLGLTRDIAEKILAIKKAAKKGWYELGVSVEQETEINKAAGK